MDTQNLCIPGKQDKLLKYLLELKQYILSL